MMPCVEQADRAGQGRARSSVCVPPLSLPFVEGKAVGGVFCCCFFLCFDAPKFVVDTSTYGLIECILPAFWDDQAAGVGGARSMPYIGGHTLLSLNLDKQNYVVVVGNLRVHVSPWELRRASF